MRNDLESDTARVSPHNTGEVTIEKRAVRERERQRVTAREIEGAAQQTKFNDATQCSARGNERAKKKTGAEKEKKARHDGRTKER